MLQRLIILGVGLIGGSLALAAKKHGLVKEVIGYSRQQSTLDKAKALGVIDWGTLDLKTAVEQPGLVFVATPLGAMAGIFAQLRECVHAESILTDGGSAKMGVMADAQQYLGEVFPRFVGGHPIAGREHSGVEAAMADLYTAKRCILTPVTQTQSQAVDVVRAFWQGVGAKVSMMDPEFHDNVLAATSHLPHVLAYALVDMLNDHAELGNVFQYTAGGFRDFTRIASSDPTMWRDISLHNADAMVKWLTAFQQEIEKYKTLISQQDAQGLYDHFARAKSARDYHIVNQGNSQP